MKIKNTVKICLIALILVSCTPAAKISPIETITQSLTSIPVLPTLTPTIQWMLLATPLNNSYSTNEEIILIIDGLFPGNCIKDQRNFLTIHPTPIEPAMQVSTLTFTEVLTLPEPNPNAINERADNIDNSRTAFVGCWSGDCSKLYIKDQNIDKVYEIAFGATTKRPIGHLHWINKDTVVVVQPGHLWTLIAAINIDKQQFEYYGMTPGCPDATPMP